jgi:hypothetical protein
MAKSFIKRFFKKIEMKFLYSNIILIGLLFCNKCFAQGCSDAGFCSIGILKPLGIDSASQKKQTISLILTNGVGDEGVSVFTPAIQYENRINEQWEVQARLTGNYASGNLGNASGAGDLFLSTSYKLKGKSNWSKSVLIGTKISLNSGNILNNKLALPMVYQSSLGTTDLIGGFSVTNYKWLFSVAFQKPLTGENDNTFLPEMYTDEDALKYPSSFHLNRKADALLRIGYSINPNQNWKINAGLLAIYHTENDTYIKEGNSNNPISIKGSQGLTLNATIALKYKLNDKFTLGLTGGSPLVVRDSRPDGLTRSIVLAPELNFNF